MHATLNVFDNGLLNKRKLSKYKNLLEPYPGDSLEEKLFCMINDVEPSGEFISYDVGYLPVPTDYTSAKRYISVKLFKDGKFNDRAIRVLSKEVASQLIEISDCPSDNLIENVYWIANDLHEYPSRCECCGNPITRFISFNKNYMHRFCSTKCMNNDGTVTSKKKQSYLEHYGVDHHFKSEEVKQKIHEKQVERNNADFDRIKLR
jgi:hypothetical protein